MSGRFDGLIPESKLNALVQAWLAEDAPSFDIGGAVVGRKQEAATLYCKAPGVLAGRPFFGAVFQHLGCTVTWNHEEGEMLSPAAGKKIAVATVQGEARKILFGERVALNTLARASGIATRSRNMVSLKEEKGWQGVVAGTRKTTPGFRLVEKHAMLVGGADCHRMDLSSMVMLKDNHIWSQGSITEAVQKARTMAGFSVKIEVECGNEQEAREAIAAGADVVMLDNFESAALGETAARLKKDAPHVIVEGSGGITVESIQSYMHPAVDVLSTSWIHQGTPHVDFSLKINH